MSLDPYSDPLNTATGQPMASQAAATAYLGPPFAGFIFQVALFGAVCSSTFSYTATTKYSQDPRWTKVLLWLVVLLDASVAAVNIVELYHYGISQQRDERSLFLVLTMDGIPPVLIGTIAMLVQGFLAHRAARLFRRRRVTRAVFLGFIGLLMFVGWVSSIGATTLFLMYDAGTIDRAKPFTFNNVAGVWMWISASIDIAISAALVIEFRRHMAGFNTTTDNLLRRLMGGAMRTALYTSVIGLVGAICGVSFNISQLSTSDILLAFTSPLASLYTLSMLYNLSVRETTSPDKPVSLAANQRLELQYPMPLERNGVSVQVELHVMSEVNEEKDELRPPPTKRDPNP